MSDFSTLAATVKRNFAFSLVVSIAVLLIVATTYLTMEPRIIAAQASDTGTFTVQQTIGDAISLVLQQTAITTDGTIDGITGGQATGTASVVVTTNDPDGYNMTILFSNNDPAMRGDTTNSTALLDYSSSQISEPSYNFEASSSAQFAYTVLASTTTDVDQSFLDNGSVCNSSGGNDNPGKCWYAATSSAYQIVNRSSAASDGATTTLVFTVHVPNSPSPAVQADTYTATATLTATNN